MKQFSDPPNQEHTKKKIRKRAVPLIWGMVSFAVFSGLLMQSCKVPSEPTSEPSHGEHAGTVVVETDYSKAETNREEPEESGVSNGKEITEATETTEEVKSGVSAETTAAETQTSETVPVPEPEKPGSVSYPRRVVSSYVDGLQADLKASQLPDLTKTPGFRDRVIIPDRRNTGPGSYTGFKKFTESGLIGEISEEEKAAGKKPLFLAVCKDPNNLSYNINGYSNSNCAKEVVIEGYTFEDVKFYTTNDQRLPGEVTIIFRNCRFSQIQSYPGENLWLVLQHCQTEGNVAGNNIIMENCFLHANGSDAINPNRNVVVRNSYIADLFRQASDAGAHIDGSQCFGDRYGGISENIIFDNVRFSVPELTYEGTHSHVNAAIANGMEYSKGFNFLFQNIVIDTGGRWYPIYNTGGETVVFKNIQVANGYTNLFYAGYVNKKARVFNVEHSPGLYVTSVWKDSSGKTHFLCSNNNMKTDKVLRVKTDTGEYTFSIPRHPTPEELDKDPVFRTYRFQDLPYDLEFVIEENISFAEFYDGNQLIRSAAPG